MKNFSFLGCVINIILYVVYVFVAMLIVWMIYWALSGGQTDAAVIDKMGYLTIILVLIVTTICRKFFYKQVWSESTIVVSAPNIAKTEKVKTESYAKKANEKMKIYVDKEIK